MAEKAWLPIFVSDSSKYSLARYTPLYRKFIEGGDRTDGYGAMHRIKEWNGTIINDVIVFESEQDKMWFVLRWS